MKSCDYQGPGRNAPALRFSAKARRKHLTGSSGERGSGRSPPAPNTPAAPYSRILFQVWIWLRCTPCSATLERRHLRLERSAEVTSPPRRYREVTVERLST